MSRETERQKLLELRSKVAKDNGQSTYLVFNDEEMEMLLDARPKTIGDLSKLKGFPKDGKRVEAYGMELVKIFDNRGGMSALLEKMNSSNIFNK